MTARATILGGVAVGLFTCVAVMRCSDGDDGRADGDTSVDASDEVIRADVAVVDAGDDGRCSVTSDWPSFRRLTEFDPCLPADVLT